MIEAVRGPLRVIELTQASGAGGLITCTVRPPAGEVWDIYSGWASHDDAAGLTVEWFIYDTIGPILASIYIGATVPQRLYQYVVVPAPFRINRECYLGFRVTGMAGAKTITVRLMVERITGVQTWTGA